MARMQRFAFVSTALALVGITRADAADVIWQNPSGGTWSAAANWSGGNPPGPNDRAVFNGLSGPYVVIFDGVQSVADIAINSANAKLTLQGNSNLGAARLTVANSVANSGVIELTDIVGSYGASLIVTNGALVNAAGAEIRTLTGFGGNRTLAAELNNQGLLSVAFDTTIGRAGAHSTNSGTIQVTGGTLIVDQSGAAPTFANSGVINASSGNLTFSGGTINSTGTLQVAAGKALLFRNSATLNYQSGTLNASGGTLTFESSVGNFTPSFTSTNTPVTLTNSTINGPGAFVNEGGLKLTNGVINAPFMNETDIFAHGNSTIKNPTQTFDIPANATLHIQGNSTYGLATLTVSNGFANAGVIEMTDMVAAYGATLRLTSGMLVNAQGAEIRSLVGSGGARTLEVELDNQGLLKAAQNTSFGRVGAHSVNNGTMQVTGGTLTVDLAGAGSTFANNSVMDVSGGNLTFSSGVINNNGTIQAAAGRALLFRNAATLNNQAGTIDTTGGTLTFDSSTGNFTANYQGTDTLVTLSSATINGPGTFVNEGGLKLSNSTINAPFVNEGDIFVSGNSTIKNPSQTFDIPDDAALYLQGNSVNGAANLTVTNGFTNSGVIELTDLVSAYGATLKVTNGALLNASGAEMRLLAGAGGNRSLSVELDNQGVVSVAQNTTIGRAGAHSSNNGAINVTGGTLTVDQTGTGPTFANSGLIDASSGNLSFSGGVINNSGTLRVSGARTLMFRNSATLNHQSGALNTAGGMLTFDSSIANFTANYSSTDTPVTLTSATINGPGTFTNKGGLKLINSVIAATFVNEADIAVNGISTIKNLAQTFSIPATATLFLQGNSNNSSANLTVSKGFTNAGAIELSEITGPYGAILTVTDGKLVNASGAEIRSLAGLSGSRTLAIELDNQGMVSVARDTTLGRAGGHSVNSGTIQVTGGTLNLDQTGVGPTFTNSGVIDGATGNLTFSGGVINNTGTLQVAAGRALQFRNSATLNHQSGTLNAANGTLTFDSSIGNFTANYSNTDTSVTLSNSTINGPGTFTNEGVLKLFNGVMSAPIVNYGHIQVSGTSRIVNPTSSFSVPRYRTLQIQGENNAGAAILTVNNGFTNSGVIELTDAVSAYGATLAVSSGVLNNAATGEVIAAIGLSGPRRFSGALNNLGLVTIEEGQKLEVTGSVTQHSPGRIDFYASGPSLEEYSRLGVSGAATLEGGIGMTLLNGYLPNIGDTIPIITYGSLTDTIGCFDVAGLFFGAGLRYNLLREPTSMKLEVVDHPVQVGDVRCDCTVDINDLSILLAHYGMPEARQSDGDLNDDQQVTLDDVAILLSYYGASCPE